MEIPVLRVQEVCKAHQDKWANPARGGVLEPMGPGECLESQDPRVTEVLTGFQVYLVRRDIGVRMVLLDPQDLPEKMDQGEKMEKLDREVWLVKAAPEVCLVLEVLLGHPGSLELLVLMVHTVPKETWDHRENQALRDNRESQEHKVFQVRRVPSGRQEKKVLMEGPVCLDCLALMDLLDILERRVHLERKVLWANLVPKGPSAILALAV